MKRIAVKISELDCIIGNLFEGLEPPCDIIPCDGLVLKGRSWSGKDCTLKIHKNYCEFEGDTEDIDAVLSGRCPDKRCKNGRL